MNLIIRKETEKDYYQTELMTQHAFWNLHVMGCSEHLLVHKLRQSNDYLPEYSLIALDNDKVVGTIMYAKATIKKENKEIICLTFGPLAVEPSYQHIGIGSRLFHESLKLIDKVKYPGIVIYGEPNYYPRLGFITCDKFNIKTPTNENFPAFMAYDFGNLSNYPGNFYESNIYELENNEVEEFNKNFPYLEKRKLPGQWN